MLITQVVLNFGGWRCAEEYGYSEFRRVPEGLGTDGFPGVGIILEEYWKIVFPRTGLNSTPPLGQSPIEAIRY
jgi:hypothetical protein